MGYPRTKYLDIYPDDCKFTASFPATIAPFPCDEHKDPSGRSVCIKANSVFPDGAAGWTELLSPISLSSFLPSTTSPPVKRLVSFETYAQYQLGFGSTGVSNEANIKILGDGTSIFPRDLGTMEHEPNWKPHVFQNLDIDLAYYTSLNFSLWQKAFVLTGGVENHIGYGGKLPAAIRLTFYYETSETPPPATLNVTVIDSQTRTGITGASVTATSLLGQYKATEVGAGLYTFSNIPEDEYTVTVVKTGYQIGEKTVSVKGTVTETFYLIFVGGGFELPSWWWLIPVGIGGVAVTWLLVRTTRPKRRAAPPIIVVK